MFTQSNILAKSLHLGFFLDHHRGLVPEKIFHFQHEKTASLKVLDRFWRRARSCSSSSDLGSSSATKVVVARGIGIGIMGLVARENPLVLEEVQC